ncbi:unnamed protein product [Psylliodes chrysocephalus]|uniref:acid phosphatase n=1 Tax=Psylliodes chrysocephalus TaxID=3402493 RepID=A0A9P0CQJ4_9CUCU|nr:unnamed protein product [Psylliodes chrysocephala]
MKFYLVINYLLCLCCATLADSELLSVVQIFRHGERTPVIFYPTDPYQNSKFWNDLGPGELTENGKHQLYNLGTFFRQRYDTFIGEVYNEKQITVKSSNSKRNIQSAKSFLDGLFSKTDQNITIEKATWPVMSVIFVCPKFDVEYLKLEGTNQKLIDINKNNKELYEYVRKHSEFPVFGLVSTFLVWDTLKIENAVKIALPEWTNAVFPQKLTEASNNLSTFVCYNEEQQKLGVGPFINELIEHFEKIIEGTEEPKTILFSGHDINIACFLGTLHYYQETNNPHVPPFASSLTFELWKDDDHFFVYIYYKPDEESIPVSVKNCGFNCEFEEFKKMFENIRLKSEDWYSECLFL